MPGGMLGFFHFFCLALFGFSNVAFFVPELQSFLGI